MMYHKQANPKTSVNNQRHNDEWDNSSSSSDEEEYDEQERILSERYGEATEGPKANQKRKRDASNTKPTDDEIAKRLNDSNNATKKKRVHTPILTEAMITGPKGLIRIRNEFPHKLQKYTLPKTSDKTKAIESSAVYLSVLMQSYREACADLAPKLHPHDTLQKIQDFGGKKTIRDYLNMMRKDVCLDHLSKVHGKERAEQLQHELDHGLKVHKLKLMEQEMDPAVATNDSISGGKEDEVIQDKNLRALLQKKDEIIAAGTNYQSSNDTEASSVSSHRNESRSAKPIRDSTRSTPPSRNINSHYSDDEDEMEATYDDVVGFTKENNLLPVNDTKRDDEEVDGVADDIDTSDKDSVASSKKQHVDDSLEQGESEESDTNNQDDDE